MMVLLFWLRRPMRAPWLILSAFHENAPASVGAQDNCLDLVRCAFLHKLSGCMRNITAFCQHLLSPINRYIGKKQISARPIYIYISVYLYQSTPCLRPTHKLIHWHFLYNNSSMQCYPKLKMSIVHTRIQNFFLFVCCTLHSEKLCACVALKWEHKVVELIR